MGLIIVQTGQKCKSCVPKNSFPEIFGFIAQNCWQPGTDFREIHTLYFVCASHKILMRFVKYSVFFARTEAVCLCILSVSGSA